VCLRKCLRFLSFRERRRVTAATAELPSYAVLPFVSMGISEDTPGDGLGIWSKGHAEELRCQCLRSPYNGWKRSWKRSRLARWATSKMYGSILSILSYTPAITTGARQPSLSILSSVLNI
jgi:hypothetical protein